MTGGLTWIGGSPPDGAEVGVEVGAGDLCHLTAKKRMAEPASARRTTASTIPGFKADPS